MYVDIWDIEIITHAAAAAAGERDTADKGEGEGDPGLQGAPDPRATGRYRVGVSLACARLTCEHACA